MSGREFAKAATVQGATAVRAAANGAVLYQVTGTATPSAHGLTIYFTAEQASYGGTSYDALAALPGVAGVADWRTFLKACFGGGATSTAPHLRRLQPSLLAHHRPADPLET